MKCVNAAWFGILCVLYLLYLTIYIYGGGINSLFDVFNWTIFPKLLLIVGPMYIYYLWRNKENMITLDYYLLFLPIAVWMLSFFIFNQNKGASNAIILEPSIVCLMTGAYLLRIPIARMGLSISNNMVAICLASIIASLAIIVSMSIPPIAD